jgi:aminoglycoside 3-N-acetyltransferase
MTRQPISARELTEQLTRLGVRRGGVLLVHTSFSRAGPIAGGPQALIAALRDALGPEGTLVMPSMSDDDDHPFERTGTPCIGMGIVADTFWRLPGVRRSDSPHAFAAAGPRAHQITAMHPLDVPHGLDSPVGRVYEADGQVLLLGVGHDANTTIHLAETMAPVRYRRSKYLTVWSDGRPVRYPYAEIDHCGERFSLLDDWLDEGGRQVRGAIGHAEARLMRSRDLVTIAVGRLRHDETVFLHPPGVDHECDEARASIPVATERLFSYGTLQLEAVQMATFGRRVAGTPDGLPGFAVADLIVEDRTVIAISGQTRHTIATFTGRAADIIAGTVFAVTAAELERADRYEVAPCQRVSVVLQSGTRAWVYVDGRHAPPQPGIELQRSL